MRNLILKVTDGNWATDVDVIILGNNSDTIITFTNQVKELARRYPKARLVVYQDHVRNAITLVYRRLGIDGYLLKENITDELIRCVEGVLAGKQFLCSNLLDHLLHVLCAVLNLQQHKSLTAREKQVAQYLVNGMKTSSIANLLGRKASTISSIKHNLFRKMGVTSIFELRAASQHDSNNTYNISSEVSSDEMNWRVD